MWQLTTGAPKQVDEAKEAVANLKIDGAADHVNAQIDLAQKIAMDVIESGCVGGTDAHFTVHMQGHASEDGTLTPGEQSPFLNVSVHQLPADSVPTPPPTPAEEGGQAEEAKTQPEGGQPAEEQPAGGEPNPGGSASEEPAAGAAAGGAGAGAGEAAPEGGATPPPDTSQQGEGPVTPPPANPGDKWSDEEAEKGDQAQA